MDFKTVADALIIGKSALDIMKQVKDILPDGPKKEEATAKLVEAEIKLKESQAATALKLGYQLCKCDYPPNIMLEISEGIFKCPCCSREFSAFGFGGE